MPRVIIPQLLYAMLLAAVVVLNLIVLFSFIFFFFLYVGLAVAHALAGVTCHPQQTKNVCFTFELVTGFI